ncbi:hypothetical protein AB0425_17775 [Actinosynnema sp. NPDC051121]
MKRIHTGAAHDALHQVDKALEQWNGTGPLDAAARAAAATALDELDALTRLAEEIRASLIANLDAAEVMDGAA